MNRLVETYVAEVKKQTDDMAERRRTQLQREVETRKDRVADDLLALKHDSKWRGLQDVESKRQLLDKQVAALQDALVRARQARVASRVLLDDQNQLSARGMLAVPSVRADPEIASLLSRISDLEAATVREPEKRHAQLELARQVTALVHGQAAVRDAEAASRKLFGGNVASMSVKELLQVFPNVPSSTTAYVAEGWPIVELLSSAGVASSKSDAARLIRGGGIYVNDRRVTDEKLRLRPDEA